MSEGLSLTEENGLARVSIQLPPVNVLRVAHLEEMARLVQEAVEARVLVLSGLPRAFSAGVEIAEHAPESGAIDRMLGAMRKLLTALIESPAVTVASVSGACLGGGAEIAAACDFVLAAEDARIGYPEIRLACFPPGAAALLPSRIGEARAIDWILTGRSFSGREAAAAGFAARAVPAAALKHETDRLAGELLARSPAALDAARNLLRESRREALLRLDQAEGAYRKLEGSRDLERAVLDFRKAKPRNP
jgi:cyclohexa-1,5-dienecarbonyl-CoA hydratase